MRRRSKRARNAGVAGVCWESGRSAASERNVSRSKKPRARPGALVAFFFELSFQFEESLLDFVRLARGLEPAKLHVGLKLPGR